MFPNLKSIAFPHLLHFFILVALPCVKAAHAQSCSALSQLHLRNARVTLANTEDRGFFMPPNHPRIDGLAAFCRVVVLARPSKDSNIVIEVWLPSAAWNRRLLGEGTGGFGGKIEYAQLSSGVRRHFAAATTDLGTFPSSSVQADVLIGHPEKWKDFGFRATHTMTAIAKTVVRAYYGFAPERSYFEGCSTGGQQGLQEAQRYPDDYDGILSGAPAYARTRLHTAILWNDRALSQAVADGLTPAKLKRLSSAVLRSCGQRSTGTGALQLEDPQACGFDVSTLQCGGEKREDCFSSGEIDALRRVYTGPVDASGRVTYPGLAWGSEAEWSLPAADARAEAPPFSSIFKWVWGPSWNWEQFDFSKDPSTLDRRLGPWVNATNPDLRNFRRRGHKLLLYHGWADPLVSPQGTIDYYERILSAEHGSPHAGKQDAFVSDDGVRLFMIPGMAHCSGGTGPERLDLLPSLRAWVEHKVAPSGIPVEVPGQGAERPTRLLCPYPQVSRTDSYKIQSVKEENGGCLRQR